MSEPLRKKSPRAPSLPLGEAIERVARIYREEGRHAAPLDVVAKHIGYNGAKHGAALQALASLRYYGLVERPKEGLMAVSKEFETYTFTQDERQKQSILVGWLKTPTVFAELLEKYTDRLPSDGNIRFDLIQKGFLPNTAEACVSVFRRSVEDAQYFAMPSEVGRDGKEDDQELQGGLIDEQQKSPVSASERVQTSVKAVSEGSVSAADIDRIPVRLAGGRRAFLEVPIPFYAADKKRLKAHIDLLLTDDEEEVLDGLEDE